MRFSLSVFGPSRAHRRFTLIRSFSQTVFRTRASLISSGVNTTPAEDLDASLSKPRQPFYFETGYAIYAKRLSRPFPPPFLSLPPGSFSDPLATHSPSRDRRPSVNGRFIKGRTNGDDAVLVDGENFLVVDDGVGAWAQKERGNAALWSRLIAHFWAVEVENAFKTSVGPGLGSLNPVTFLQNAFEQTQTATSAPNEIQGTTTVCSVLLHYRSDTQPFVYITNLGDCTALIIRPRGNQVIYRTEEQWHWFDCPRQLGTNSPDTPNANAKMDVVDIEEDDVIVVIS